MVSAAEQLAANLNFGAFAKAEDLKKRLWFTLGALLVYRLGTFIPLPGIDPVAFAQAFKANASGILGMFNMFAGGAVERMAIFALNIMPYISASIIMQLMTSVSPTLESLEEGGRAGPQADQPVHALLDRGCSRRSRPTALRWAGGLALGGRRSSSIRAGSSASRPCRDAGRRHHVPDVARRADHAARRRQRHLAHHLRRHRRRLAVGHRGPASSSPARGRCRRSCCSCCSRSCRSSSPRSSSWSGRSGGC